MNSKVTNNIAIGMPFADCIYASGINMTFILKSKRKHCEE